MRKRLGVIEWQCKRVFEKMKERDFKSKMREKKSEKEKGRKSSKRVSAIENVV